MEKKISVKKFLLKKFPTKEYMDCPIPKSTWELMQEYAEEYAAQFNKQDSDAINFYKWTQESKNIEGLNGPTPEMFFKLYNREANQNNSD